MSDLLQAAITFLEADGWSFATNREARWISLNYPGEAGSWLSWIKERGPFLIAYASLPVNVPAPKRGHVAEFLTYVNDGLAVGNFELDFESGTVRSKNGFYAGDGELSPTIAKKLFQYCNWTMNDYYTSLMSLVFGTDTAAIAYAEAVERLQKARRAVEDSDAVATDSANAAQGAKTEVEVEVEQLLASLERSLDQARPTEDGPGQVE